MKKLNFSSAACAALLTLAAAVNVHAQVILNDNFSGNTGDIQSATTPYSNDSGGTGGSLTVNSGVATYSVYYGEADNNPATFTFGDEAGVGPNGAAGLVFSLSQSTGQFYDGYNSSPFATTFTPGAVTAAEIGTLVVSMDIHVDGANGYNFNLFPSDSNGNSLNNNDIVQIFTNGSSLDSGTTNGLPNFQHVEFDFSSLSGTTLQSFADALNSGNSNLLGINVQGTFGNGLNPASTVLSNLIISEGPAPEPSTWALMGLGVVALALGRRFVRVS